MPGSVDTGTGPATISIYPACGSRKLLITSDNTICYPDPATNTTTCEAFDRRREGADVLSSETSWQAFPGLNFNITVEASRVMALPGPEVLKMQSGVCVKVYTNFVGRMWTIECTPAGTGTFSMQIPANSLTGWPSAASNTLSYQYKDTSTQPLVVSQNQLITTSSPIPFVVNFETVVMARIPSRCPRLLAWVRGLTRSVRRRDRPRWMLPSPTQTSTRPSWPMTWLTTSCMA